MYKIIRSYDAREDMKEIARYTRQQWGDSQMKRYLAELDGTIDTLAANPSGQGVSRADLREGLRSIPHQNHYHIFYRVRGNTVEIIRILHQSMNWQRFFHEG